MKTIIVLALSLWCSSVWAVWDIAACTAGLNASLAMPWRFGNSGPHGTGWGVNIECDNGSGFYYCGTCAFTYDQFNTPYRNQTPDANNPGGACGSIIQVDRLAVGE